MIHYDFEIKHIKNINNIVTNAYNRRANYESKEKKTRKVFQRNETTIKLIELTKKTTKLIKQSHDTRLVDHQKIIKTLQRLQERTNFDEMKKTMKNYIKNCSICVMTKTSRIDKKKQLQSFLISNASFETMTLNFVTKLSKLSNSTTRQFYNMIMTIMNELIKYAKFI